MGSINNMGYGATVSERITANDEAQEICLDDEFVNEFSKLFTIDFIGSIGANSDCQQKKIIANKVESLIRKYYRRGLFCPTNDFCVRVKQNINSMNIVEICLPKWLNEWMREYAEK